MKTVIAQVVQSYSGRKDLVFNEREFEDFMSECSDGDKIKMEVLPNGYKVTIDERYKRVLSVAEQTAKMKLTETREAVNALIRSIVAYRLVKEGYHYSEIGRVMGRNHSTISHYVRKVENMLSVPLAYRREICLFKEIERILDE